MKVAPIVLLTLLLVAPPLSAEQTYSFQIVPSVALGPLVLSMNPARARSAMPEPVSMVDTQEARNGDGSVFTRIRMRWMGPREGGEGQMPVMEVVFENGRMKYAAGADHRLAYRGRNLRDHTLETLTEALGVPERLAPSSASSSWIVWDAKGVAFRLQESGNGRWTASAVMVFPKAGWDDL